MAIKIGFVTDLLVDSQLVRTFYAKNWKKKIALSEKVFYEWQFIHTPNSDGKDHLTGDLDKGPPLMRN